MATHDYVIDNSTGANVRADINNVLQAILTNNSSSSAPSTTAAYMWWADTTNGVLKIRNSSDNAWVELLQLDGTLTLEDGSVSAPALAFRDDLDTGIYSPSANTIAIATGGVERLQLSTGGFIFNEDGADIDFRIESDDISSMFFVDAGNNRVGISDGSPSCTFEVGGTTSQTAIFQSNQSASTISVLDTDGDGINISGGTAFGHRILTSTTEALALGVNNAIKMTIDSSGRLLIGHTTSTPMDNDANNPIFAVEGTGNGARIAVRSDDSTAGNGAFIYLTRTRGTTVGSKTTVQSGDALGGLIFMGADGTHDTRAAQIRAECDGTPGDNDMPGRIVFETTPDGGINTVEAMRIRSDKRITVGGSSGTGYTGAFGIHQAQDLLDLNSSSSSTNGKIKFYEGGAGRMNIETLGGTAGLLIYDSLNAVTRVKIHSAGHITFDKTNTADNSGTGFVFRPSSIIPNMSNVCDTSTFNHSTYHLYNLNSTNNGYRFYVQANGGVVNHSGNNVNLSDERMKKNITNMGSVYENFKKFVFRDFNYISDASSEIKKHGVIAQEVETIDADLVTDDFKVSGDDNENYVYRKGLKEEQFMMIGFKALQEAIAKIEVLETKVAALEAA